MRIEGLTTCVGERYAGYLEKSLPIWLDTLDSVTVVTDAATDDILPNLIQGNLQFHVTDIFTRHGASFNKGAALSSGFATIKKPDWILNFDADIIPPQNWRKDIERLLLPRKLFGCSRRFRSSGDVIPDSAFPDLWGFFHLWHVSDPHNWIRPVYPVDCGHAGNYDHTFLRRWPEDCRVDLSPPLKLIHQGEPRTSWFGGDPKNAQKMLNLFTLGLWEAWWTKAGHIQVPEPEVNEVIERDDLKPEEIQQVLDRYTDMDPFRYAVRIE